MQAAEFQRLHDYESWYWWCSAQRANLIEAVRRLPLARRARVLDAGCGSGRNLIELARTLGVTPYGVDVSAHAAALWNGEPGVHRCRASVNELPYADRSFNVVCSVDLMQCRGVDTRRAVREMARVLKPGGYVVVLAPAYQWMLSRHDVAVHSVHRFTCRELRALVRHAGLTVETLTHRFPLFFPVIAATRLVRKIAPKRRASPPRSDLSEIPRWLNRTLLAIARAEQRITQRIHIPFGSTVLLIARKGRV